MMQSFIALLLPSLAWFLPVFAGILGFKLYLRFEQKKPIRRPFTKDFMRLPGQSLQDKIEIIREEFDTNLLFIFVAPILIFTIHVSQSYFIPAPETKMRLVSSVIMVIGTVIYFLYKLIKNRKELTVLRLGLDGEVATAQLLDPLKRKGFYIYHDFQAKGFNIDHVLVGPSGVFAVETKARSKPDRGNNTADSRIVFDGRQLIFPDYKESKSIEQAKRQAQWLNKWLSSAVGEQVPVSPLLVIPGWFVELKAKLGGIYITNGTNLEFIVRMNGGASLTEKQINQITHQLEQKCVDDTKEKA